MTSTALAGRSRPGSIRSTAGVAGEFAVDLTLLFTAYLTALYMRRELPFGRFVGTNYDWYNPRAYVVVAVCLAAVYALRLSLRRRRPSERTWRFWGLVLGIVLACLALTIFLPHLSGLQKVYFAVSALALAVLVVPPPRTDVGVEREPSLRTSLGRLWRSRSLLRIWVQYNVQSRYAQALLGILWIVLLPLTTAFVMSVVFSQIMRIQIHNVPFIAFFLAGFVPWGLFNQSIAAGMRSILSAMGLINQIYFPREIIVLSALGEALVDTAFMFLAMLVVDAVVGIFPNPLYLVLPMLLLIQIALCLGLMLVVSWLSVLVRDVPQLVSVLLQILFYLSPIIYPVTIVPHQYRFLVTLNPLAVIVEAYHRIIVYDQPPDWFSLLYPAALAAALLVFGYRLFKSNEDRMADMV
jgi:lipopolysaccharide transport system permease protein